jgi:hypothetical protein
MQDTERRVQCGCGLSERRKLFSLGVGPKDWENQNYVRELFNYFASFTN